MSRRASFALALALLCACEKKVAPPSAAEPAAPVAKAASVPSPADAGTIDAHPPSVPTWAFDCRETGTPKHARSIGHTSVVYKVELSTEKKAAFKPNAERLRSRYKGEIAAYRLAQALGLPNVPPACLRTFAAAELKASLAGNPAGAKLFGQVIVDHDQVRGVLIPWIEGLRFWPIEKDPLRTQVRGWLASAEIPPDQQDLARQASNLVAFDFLTGNWDRHSGENVGLDASGRHVLFIDNDAAFMEGPPADQLARNRADVEATARFSRGLVEAVRKLGPDGLRTAIGDEDRGTPLLSDAVLASVGGRMKDLLAIVDEKVRTRGEAATLYFP